MVHLFVGILPQLLHVSLCTCSMHSADGLVWWPARRAELEEARASAVRWLQLAPGSSWADIAACAQQKHSELYAE